jgi:hypothetical protein
MLMRNQLISVVIVEIKKVFPKEFEPDRDQDVQIEAGVCFIKLGGDIP